MNRTTMHPPRASLIIPTHNGLATIARCLKSVFSAAEGLGIEIIVIDSSADNTPSFIEKNFSDVRIFRSTEGLSAGRARNIGVEVTVHPL